jgi:hypothetical protein
MPQHIPTMAKEPWFIASENGYSIIDLQQVKLK